MLPLIANFRRTIFLHEATLMEKAVRIDAPMRPAQLFQQCLKCLTVCHQYSTRPILGTWRSLSFKATRCRLNKNHPDSGDPYTCEKRDVVKLQLSTFPRSSHPTTTQFHDRQTHEMKWQTRDQPVRTQSALHHPEMLHNQSLHPLQPRTRKLEGTTKKTKGSRNQAHHTQKQG